MNPLLDFETFIYKSIGERITNYRKKLNLKQEGFLSKLQVKHHLYIDRHRLSYIENGNVYVNKNPNLLTVEQIKVFSEEMGCDPIELILGDYREREESVRLFLLAIIMNSEKDKEEEYIIPFMDFVFRYKNSPELEELINRKSGKNKNRTITLKENEERYLHASGIMNGLNKVEEKYPFFTSNRMYVKYQNILGVSSLRIELTSNLLIKLLMGDFEFASHYIRRMSSLCELSGSNEVVYSFIENKGMIGGSLIGNKNSFYVFINAFENMWKRHKKMFMEYFEEHLFNKIINAEIKYKGINNELLNDVITDSEFSNLVFLAIEKDRFSIKTMDGHYLFYQHLLNRYVDKEIENSIESPK